MKEIHQKIKYLDLAFDDFILKIEAIFRKRRKKISFIALNNKSIRVLAPYYLTQKDLLATLARSRKQIFSLINKTSPRYEFNNGAIISILGEDYKICYENLVPNETKVKKLGSVIFVDKLSLNKKTAKKFKNMLILEQDIVRLNLVFWLKRLSAKLIKFYCLNISKELKIFPKSFTIKSYVARWGCCYQDNSIKINWHLILAPKRVIRYVIVHELCHCTVKNHSRLFWNKLSNYISGYKFDIAWLKANCNKLLISYY